MNSDNFGTLLRRWRNQRGRSQLELGELAGYSQRHISFLENARAQPSRKTVINLAQALAVPLTERNALLQAAGFAPLFSAEPLNSETLRFALAALQGVLERHRPFAALVVDRAWNMYAANLNALALFNLFSDAPLQPDPDQPLNVLHMTLRHDGSRPYIRNWCEFASQMLAQLKSELDLDPAAPDLRQLVHAFASDPELIAYQATLDTPDPAPFSVLEMVKGSQRVRLMTLVSQFASPNDATLSQLRIETFFPADDASRELMLQLDAQAYASQPSPAQPAQNVFWLRQEP